MTGIRLEANRKRRESEGTMFSIQCTMFSVQI